MKNRTLNRLWARSHGYFWLPCPICGQEFGGHEWRTDRHVFDHPMTFADWLIAAQAEFERQRAEIEERGEGVEL